MIPASRLSAKCEPEGGSLDRPLDHLLACHRRIEQRLETLERATAAFDDRPEEARQAIANVLRFFDTNGLWHTQDEEHSLFPRLLKRLDSARHPLLDRLHAEHEEAESAYAALKDAIESGSPARVADLVPALAAIYRAHIATEDAALIPLGHDYLNDEDLTAIAAEMKQRRGL